MENERRYVCAFRGRRDSYQVPLALAEADKLDQFITDLYCPSSTAVLDSLLSNGVRERLRSRREDGIPESRVRSLWGITALEHARHRLGFAHQDTYAMLDRQYSLAARDRARKTESNLFLYSPYALDAFTAAYRHQPRRVLFQFHPHIDTEREILAKEARAFPEAARSRSEPALASAGAIDRERDCWRHADLIVCASSFTKRTLVDAGADPASCKVIPYGVETPKHEESGPSVERFEALFVGTGIRRKGLHHLIRAWKSANLATGSRLTLVCRAIENGLAEMIMGDDSIRLLRRTSEADLIALYQSSSLFVMPSLIEGFGQVFLEALAAGCPVLGTENTCLPDLGEEQDGIFLTGAGKIDELTTQLELFSRSVPRLAELREPARCVARRLTWGRFRENILASLALLRRPNWSASLA